MWEHIRREHPELIDWGNPTNEQVPDETFEFTITGEFRDPLSRQLTEMVLIRMAHYDKRIRSGKGGVGDIMVNMCLNSREENFAPFIKKGLRQRRNIG